MPQDLFVEIDRVSLQCEGGFEPADNVNKVTVGYFQSEKKLCPPNSKVQGTVVQNGVIAIQYRFSQSRCSAKRGKESARRLMNSNSVHVIIVKIIIKISSCGKTFTQYLQSYKRCSNSEMVWTGAWKNMGFPPSVPVRTTVVTPAEACFSAASIGIPCCWSWSKKVRQTTGS